MSATPGIEHINEFRRKVKEANKELTKKEAFKDLLNRLYAANAATKSVIDAISAGAEQTILNIPRQDKAHRGQADTLYNKIIIEFENDLKKTGRHAKEQLAGYLLGQFNSGEGYNFTLIASDFLNWKLYAPDVSCLDRLETLQEDELILNEIESSSFTLTEHNAEEFYYWLDRFLFQETKQKATLKRVEQAFGYQSHVFIHCYRELKDCFRQVKTSGEVQVSFEQWNRFLSIAYGAFEATDDNFLIHTYLSVFAKMLAYAVVSNDDYIDDEEMREIINGEIFRRYNIANFVENDFFHWIQNESCFRGLRKAFRRIAQQLSAFDFQEVDEDILKGVYQELIDLDTRHALGEYYTPDWLCERVTAAFDFAPDAKILDPSCGSGSFLRAAIKRIRQLQPNVTIAALNEQIHGIDIHPLSVQIAKTTLLLAYGRDVINERKPLHLNVLLANTLLAPQGVGKLWGNFFQMQIDKQAYELHTAIFADVGLFDEGLSVCEELAGLTQNQSDGAADDFARILRQRTRRETLNDDVSHSFYEIYRGFKRAKESGRDSIWKFIVQNLYKPYFLAEKFDYVIGNPPWFTFSSIRNEDYQNTLDELAKAHAVKPERQANYPHLEIAAIFLAYCSGYFLRDGGRIAFVLPRSFFSADHHDNTRRGAAKGFTLTAAWDLDGVTPLFRIPGCVLFAEKGGSPRVSKGVSETPATPLLTRGLPPPSGLPSVSRPPLSGLSFSGKLPAHNCNWLDAQTALTETAAVWHYVTQGKSSALSTRQPSGDNKPNPYNAEFKQGATIVPRAFYFVELHQAAPPDLVDRILNLRTAAAIQPDAKRPWINLDFKGRLESRFLFRTALAKSILPFALFQPQLVALPLTSETNQAGGKTLKLHSANDLRQAGWLDAARWFGETEKIWDERKTEKSKDMTNLKRLDFQRGLTGQNLNAPYLVLYNSSAQDANAAIVKREDLDLEFIVDHKAYLFTTHNLNEAYYLAAVLNSSVPNALIKDFQSRGLYGARDVHKKILDVWFPRYDGSDATHLRLAELSAAAHAQASEYLRANPPEAELNAGRLGRLRVEIKQYLANERQEMDNLVARIMA